MLHPFLLFFAFLASSAQQATSPEARRASWELHERMARESPFKELEWRSVGPKFQGGRIEAIAWPAEDPQTVYVGVGSGGVFKTTDEGKTWTPLFDDQSTTAIGSIAVAPTEPQTVWVGTGETHPSGTSFPGSGIFKSTDGGATWKNKGLDDSHHIARVIVDPEDADVVYAGVMGHHRSSNETRGVYKTCDGGETWERVLFMSDSVGIVDLVMDPLDRSTLYAASWDRRGDGSAIHKSVDAGATWTVLKSGLPEGQDTGRIGLHLSARTPGLLYALVVNRKLAHDRDPGGAELYRSADGGSSFLRTHEQPLPTWIGWDFCDVRVSPDESQRVYLCGQRLWVSDDEGATFERAGERIRRLHPHRATVLHLDMHELELDPNTPGRMWLGTDGGLFLSTDHAQSWLHLNNLPIGEFYTVHLDDQRPYRIWGGTQDNASLYGPSTYEVDSSSPDPWQHVFLDRWGGGDGFVTLPDPTDPEVVYFETQLGDLRRKRLNGPLLLGQEDKRIRPRPAKDEPELKFAWNTPLLVSHHDPHTLYCAAQHVFKSVDRGDAWLAIGSDLGQREILSLSESPLKPGLLYAGTHGGVVHVTRDDGESWRQVREGLPTRTVTRVVASRHEEGLAYVALSGARWDEFGAHLYRTRDFGQTWQSIGDGLPVETIYALVEDPEHGGVVYVGTLLGVYVTLDGGATWASLSHGLPAVPVFDMQIHSRDHELVIATHGRSVFVLDVGPIHGALKEGSILEEGG